MSGIENTIAYHNIGSDLLNAIKAYKCHCLNEMLNCGMDLTDDERKNITDDYNYMTTMENALKDLINHWTSEDITLNEYLTIWNGICNDFMNNGKKNEQLLHRLNDYQNKTNV